MSAVVEEKIVAFKKMRCNAPISSGSCSSGVGPVSTGTSGSVGRTSPPPEGSSFFSSRSLPSPAGRTSILPLEGSSLSLSAIARVAFQS